MGMHHEQSRAALLMQHTICNPVCQRLYKLGLHSRVRKAWFQHAMLQRDLFVQGLLAPLAASVSIFTIYLIIRYLPNFSIQTLFDVVFLVVGCNAVYNGAITLLKVRLTTLSHAALALVVSPAGSQQNGCQQSSVLLLAL